MIKGPIDGKSQKVSVKIQLWKWGSHLALQKIHPCLHQVWNTVWTGRAAEAFLSLTWSRETEEAELRREEHRQAGSAGGAPPHWQQERGASWHVRPERLLTSPCSPLQAPGKVQQRASPGISSVFGIKRNARREDKASISLARISSTLVTSSSSPWFPASLWFLSDDSERQLLHACLRFCLVGAASFCRVSFIHW